MLIKKHNKVEYNAIFKLKTRFLIKNRLKINKNNNKRILNMNPRKSNNLRKTGEKIKISNKYKKDKPTLP